MDKGKDAAVRPRQGWSEVFDWREAAAFAPPRPRLRLGHPSSFEKGNFEPVFFLRCLGSSEGSRRVQLEVRGINLSSELKNHPEGMPAISRWLRPKAAPPVLEQAVMPTPAGVAPDIDYLQAVIPPGSIPGFNRIRGYRFAKPPANGWRPSGSSPSGSSASGSSNGDPEDRHRLSPACCRPGEASSCRRTQNGLSPF